MSFTDLGYEYTCDLCLSKKQATHFSEIKWRRVWLMDRDPKTYNQMGHVGFGPIDICNVCIPQRLNESSEVVRKSFGSKIKELLK